MSRRNARKQAIAERLDTLFVAAGLTFEDVGRALSVSSEQARKYVRGIDSLRLRHLMAFAALFSVHPADIAGEEELWRATPGVAEPAAPFLSALEARLLAVFAQLDPAERAELITSAERLLDR